MRDWIVSSSLLILLVLALRGIFQGRIRPRIQYALWLLVLLRLLLPFHFGSSSLSFVQVAREGQTAVEQAFVEPMIQNYVAMDEQERPAAAPEKAEQNRYPAAADREARNPAELLPLVWAGGSMVTALAILLSNLHFSGRLRRSRKRVGQEGRLPVYQCRWLETPCLFGLLRPAIYIGEMGEERELRHVLCHERMHHRQGDHLWSLLRSVCLVLHWYNPLVWLAAVLSRRDGELACDEAVIRALGEGERVEYGRTLLRMTIRGREPVLRMATTMKGSGKSIARRIRFIARRPYMKLYTLLTLLLVAAVAAGCAFTGAKQEIILPVEEASPTVQPLPTATPEPKPLRHEESFFNEAGDVEFLLDFEVPELAEAMPVLEMKSRDVTIEDAKAMAKAVFGTTELYERKTHRYRGFDHELLTAEAAEEYLAFARSMQEDEELLRTVYGERFLAMGQDIVSNVLREHDRPEYLSQLPAEAERARMNWEFVSDQSNPAIVGMKMNGSFEQNGLRYRFSAVNYDDKQEPASNHGVYVAVEQGYLAEMAQEKAYLEHSSETEPTREQFAAAQTEAIRILEEMEPGKWYLSSCEGWELPNGRYIIEIQARPVYEDFALLRQDTSSYLIDQQEMVVFRFGADGVLLYMRWMDPMEESGETPAADTLNFDTAMNLARNYFQDGTVAQYDYWITGPEGTYHDGIRSKVYISDVQQGWLRVPVEGQEDAITLQPVISFLGYFESFDENGEETEWSKTRANTPVVLLNLSALDGSVLVYQSKTHGVNGLPRQ